MKKFLMAVVLGVVSTVGVSAGAATAAPVAQTEGGGEAGTSAYVFDSSGLTLKGNDKFKASQHVNIRYIKKTGGETGAGIHFDPNNGHPGSKYIGDNFIPWSAFGSDIACISWVQVADRPYFNQDGKSEPYCITKPSTAPPTEKDRETKETAVCDLLKRDWKVEKFERDVVFKWDLMTAKWVRDANQREFTLVDTSYRDMTVEEYRAACPTMPEVGSGVEPWMMGVGALMVLAGGGVAYRQRRRGQHL